ncbi:MAG: radical SAM protein [Mariprofundaceae bacterium]
MKAMRMLRFVASGAARVVDSRALYAQLVMTRDCNLSCAYCNEYDTGAPHVAMQDLLSRIDRLDELGVLVYDLLGGEPLLHPGLADLVRHIKRKHGGVNLANVISNGFLLTEEKITSLNAAGLDLMQLSVDSVRPGPDSMKSLKSLLPKLDLLARQARFTVKIQTVLTESTAQEYGEFRDMLEAYPFDFSFSLLHEAGGKIAIAGEVFAQLLDRHDLWGGMRLYRDHAEALLRGEDSKPWRCLGGSKFLYVTAGGVIQWCSQQPGDALPLARTTPADLKRAHVHKPCEEGCALGCARLVSHALGEPLKTAGASLATLAGVGGKQPAGERRVSPAPDVA